MKKRLLSMLLSICLLVTLMPSTVFADDQVTPYDVWVGGVQVTSENASNVLADGKVSYDHSTKTLTLTNAAITDAHSVEDSKHGIYVGVGDLTLNLEGENSITIPASAVYNYGIYVKRNLSITGNGRLTVTGGDSTMGFLDQIFGVYSLGALTAESGVTLTVTAATADCSYSIAAWQDVTINGGTVTATGGSARTESRGIFGNSGVTINDGTVIATGGPAQISWGIYGTTKGTTINDGTVTAKGGTAAMNKAPVLTAYTGHIVTASENTSGVPTTGYSESEIASYKYLQIAPAPTDEQLVAAAKAAAQGAAYPTSVQYDPALAGAANNASWEKFARDAIKNPDISVHIELIVYTAAVNGTATNPEGSGGSYTFTVTVSKGNISATTGLMVVLIHPVRYEGVNDAQAVAAAKAAAQGAAYPTSMTQESAATLLQGLAANLKAIATAAIKNSAVSVSILQGIYTAPVAGTATKPNGTDGSYPFTVMVYKDMTSATTVPIVITITATPYSGGGTPTEPVAPIAPSTPSTPSVPPIVVKPVDSSGSVTGTSVSLNLAQLPSGVSKDEVIFSAKQQSATSAPVQAVEAALAGQMALPAANAITAYDLEFLLKSTGAKVNFTGEVTVTLPIPTGYGRFLRVFHVADNGTMTEVPAVISGSNLLLTLRHFSYYAIVDFSSSAGKLPTTLTAKAPATTTSAETAKPSSSGNTTANPRTGAAAIPVGAFLLALAGMTASRKRRVVK